MAQIRAVILHFFRGLLFWKNLLAVAALLVLLRFRTRLALPPAPTSDTARPPPRRSLCLLLDSSLIAPAVAQLFTQTPPLTGANATPAEAPAELFLGPGQWRRNALLGLRLSPEFWQMLCELFAIRVAPREGTHPHPRPNRYLELHVVDDEDVVLREALQDDLQRYRQCGLHDGLQDTSQDEQESDVQDSLSPGASGARGPRQHLPGDTRVRRLLYIRSARRGSVAINRQLAARALTHFLTAVYAQSTSTLVGVSPPGEGATLEELPGEEQDADLD